MPTFYYVRLLSRADTRSNAWLTPNMEVVHEPMPHDDRESAQTCADEYNFISEERFAVVAKY